MTNGQHLTLAESTSIQWVKTGLLLERRQNEKADLLPWFIEPLHISHFLTLFYRTMSRKQTPSEFLKQIIGRPVVVKLNSGVDYRGESEMLSQ